MSSHNLHLVSDSTGETVAMLARACVAQFDEIKMRQHSWPLVREGAQIDKVLAAIRKAPGLVLFTMVDSDLRKILEDGLEDLKVPYLCVLDPVLAALGTYLKAEAHLRPGYQHALGAADFERIEAINFSLIHDDGQAAATLNRADVVLVGVSRTSKTPTCIYLANRGIKAANVPVVPGCPLPQELFKLTRPLVVGLTKDPRQLVKVRKHRLELMHQDPTSDYVDVATVNREVEEAKRLCNKHGWPLIDVSGKSIEETATLILQHLKDRVETGW
ncbi:MAG: kinase/pyrophosphorylase [Magnetospirillum sp. WYHS-4]